MEEKKFTYQIGEKEYVMKPLVLGQVNQLIKLLKGVEFPSEGMTALTLVNLFGDKISKALAIILREENVTLKGRDIDKVAEDLEFDITPEKTMEVVEDFFDCTPISSLLERMGLMIEKISDKIIPKTTGSTESLSSSQSETSQNVTT